MQQVECEPWEVRTLPLPDPPSLHYRGPCCSEVTPQLLRQTYAQEQRHEPVRGG